MCFLLYSITVKKSFRNDQYLMPLLHITRLYEVLQASKVTLQVSSHKYVRKLIWNKIDHHINLHNRFLKLYLAEGWWGRHRPSPSTFSQILVFIVRDTLQLVSHPDRSCGWLCRWHAVVATTFLRLIIKMQRI